eukprot:1161470-Pelagomonas_calceolata.AAC.4
MEEKGKINSTPRKDASSNSMLHLTQAKFPPAITYHELTLGHLPQPPPSAYPGCSQLPSLCRPHSAPQAQHRRPYPHQQQPPTCQLALFVRRHCTQGLAGPGVQPLLWWGQLGRQNVRGLGRAGVGRRSRAAGGSGGT